MILNTDIPYFWEPYGWGTQSLGHNVHLCFVCVIVFTCLSPTSNFLLERDEDF